MCATCGCSDPTGAVLVNAHAHDHGHTHDHAHDRAHGHDHAHDHDLGHTHDRDHLRSQTLRQIDGFDARTVTLERAVLAKNDGRA